MPWWGVGFGHPALISEVIVFNRTDGGWGSRINTFTVTLYMGDSVAWSIAGNTFAADITGTDIAGMTFDTAT